MKKALDTKQVRERIDGLGGEIAASTAETDRFLKLQIDKWAKVIKVGNIKAD